MSKSSQKYRYFFICAFLILSTFVLYWPVHNHNFIYYDDIDYIVNNPHVNTGLSWQNFLWAFNIGYASNWHPLTWLSHMLDCQLFGLNPGQQHMVNVLFHIASTLLLFIVLQRMTRALWASAFVAAVFALHPLHVESVAWLAERKDVLSTFFWMLTMLAYVRYAERPGPASYITTLLLFALGLMAKPMLVTLPFVLLLLDYWPLGRIHIDDDKNDNLQNHSSRSQIPRKEIPALVLEKVPFFVLSFSSAIMTLLAQRAGGAVVSADALSLKNRLANAVVSYTAYIDKMFWPDRLAVLYPHPVSQLPLTKVIYSVSLLLAITFVCIYFSRRLKFLMVGWLWYIGTLVPVIGIVQVGAQSMADRYTYIPLTGLFIIVAWTFREIARRGPRITKSLLAFLAAVTLLALSLCSLVQLTQWRNSATLLKHTIDVTEGNHIILNNYANILRHDGRYDEAIELYHKALRIRPKSPQILNNLGLALQEKGNDEEAITCFQKAIELTKNKRLKPNQPKGFAEANYNLANLLRKQQRIQEALQYYNKALEITPNDTDTLHSLGVTLAELKEHDQAIKHYQKALQLRPDRIITHGQLGLALAATGNLDEAIEHFRIVLKARPDDAEMHFNLGALLQKQGKTDQAIESYRRALGLDPGLEKARIRLNTILTNQKSDR